MPACNNTVTDIPYRASSDAFNIHCGVPKENVKVTARGNLLTIQAEKREEKRDEDPNRRFLRRELVYGTTTRTIR